MFWELLSFLGSLCLICMAAIVVTFSATIILAIVKATIKQLRK